MCVLENEDESLYPTPASAVAQAVVSAGAILMEDLTGDTHTDQDQDPDPPVVLVLVLCSVQHRAWSHSPPGPLAPLGNWSPWIYCTAPTTEAIHHIKTTAHRIIPAAYECPPAEVRHKERCSPGRDSSSVS